LTEERMTTTPSMSMKTKGSMMAARITLLIVSNFIANRHGDQNVGRARPIDGELNNNP
jgi:hypothetical protein